MGTSLARVIKDGWVNFWRNFWLSSATISVTVLMLFVVTGLLVLHVGTQAVLQILNDKVDISVYFETHADEEEILRLKSDLQNFREVRNVEYISRSEALTNFKERHKENALILNSLRELDANPLEATLNVKAYEASQYQAIADFLESETYQNIIDKVNYRENEALIGRLFSVTNTVRRAGLALSLVLGLVAALVTFNTVRLAIYSRREEIGIMRLVGAGAWYTRGPFLVQGLLVGVFSSLITLGLSYMAIALVSDRVSRFIPGLDLLHYFAIHSAVIIGLEVGLAVVLGVASSFIAVRKYLRV